MFDVQKINSTALGPLWVIYKQTHGSSQTFSVVEEDPL